MPPFEFLGPYRIGEVLGRGGMGTVYRAVHETTKEPVAVKLIAAQVADEPKFRRRFDAEVKTLQRLRHEGIVRLIGFGEEDGQLFYSMELVEGESLQARIKRQKKIDWPTTLDIAIQVCAALKHAHDIGVIHRDLKPANLILTDNDQVKLVDFGIAKIFGDGEQTMVGSVLGTADYMAPEQTTSSGITVRTDLYSLGSLMYAMLTGRPPFSGRSTTEVIASLKRDRPVPLDIIDPGLPDELVELVHQLLEKDPGDRPPTALAVMNRLRAMRAGLLRDQTVIAEDSPTELGPKTNATADTNLTSLPSEESGPRNVSEDPTVLRQGGSPETRAEQEGRTGGDQGERDSGTRPTEVSDTRRSKTLPPGGGHSGSVTKKTHFQTVEQRESPPSVFSSSDHQANPLTHWIGITSMLVALVVGATLLGFAMRPPSADQLYLVAMEKDDSGARRAFIKRFPDDPRVIEIRDREMAAQIRGIVNRLTAQDKLGITPLSAMEQGFLSVMQGREQSPHQARERLTGWLDAFGTEENRGDPRLSNLIELASYERERLRASEPEPLIDPRLTDLLTQIDDMESMEDAEEAQRRLRGIITTFQDQPWAEPAIKRAAEALQRSH